jgi:predicted metal-binding membrane protein
VSDDVGGTGAAALPRLMGPQLVMAIGGSIVVVTGLAWAWTVAKAGAPACHLLPLGDFVVMWTVMMAAMMLPSLAPTVLVYTAMARTRSAWPAYGAMLFAVAYLAVWGLLGVPVHAALGLVRAAVPADVVGASAGGLLLVACGVYQLTPLKQACLRHCRLPQLFLGHHWRDGLGGAFVLGAHHAIYCAGCCASLMVVLLVVGMMDLAWMVGLTAVIYLEKVVPTGGLVSRVAGLALCVFGIGRMLA